MPKKKKMKNKGKKKVEEQPKDEKVVEEKDSGDKKNVDEVKGEAKSVQEPSITLTKIAEAMIKALIEKGKKQGYLTYEQMNEELPDEAISPNRLDSLLMTLDEQGVQLIDESDIEKQVDSDFSDDDKNDGSDSSGASDGDLLLEGQLVEPEVKRIDDPVRMYLTQMGEISLLSRDEEINLARKIELTRMGFRRKVLEIDYSARMAVEILQQVHDGTLPFDRTMKMSTTENLVRSVVKSRLPENIGTVNKLLDRNADIFDRMIGVSTIEEARKDIRQIHRSRRKVATLLEELSLRTSRIQPMMKKLIGIRQKMHQLENLIAAGPSRDYTEEDIAAMKQEFVGLQDLVLETPKQLDKRLRAIEIVYGQYEQAKRDLSEVISGWLFLLPRSTVIEALASWILSRRVIPA